MWGGMVGKVGISRDMGGKDGLDAVLVTGLGGRGGEC